MRPVDASAYHSVQARSSRDRSHRVLVIAPTPFFGDRGCHVRILEETRALAELGIASEIVTYPSGRDVPGLTIHRATRVPGVAINDVGPSYGRVALDVSMVAAAARAVRRFNPDVLHAHLHEGIAVGAALRRRFGIPLVADLQGSLTAELIDHQFLAARGPLTGLVRRVERWLVRQPDAVLVSARNGLPLLASLGASEDRLEWLPDGADLERFYPARPDPALRARLGLGDAPVVVFLGLLTPYQGVDLLIEAIPSVLQRVPHARFLVMGYPNDTDYREKVRARGLAHAVTLTGRISYAEAVQYLTLGDIAVSPKQSTTEANGKLLNYMACGLPTVATDTPVNRDLLGETGVYAPVGDAAALAARLADLLEDPGRRARLSRAVRERAESEFAWPVLAGRLAAVYDRVSVAARVRHAATA
jgi:glycosyltransferase involved in cell wall biosynthesis